MFLPQAASQRKWCRPETRSDGREFASLFAPLTDVKRVHGTTSCLPDPSSPATLVESGLKPKRITQQIKFCKRFRHASLGVDPRELILGSQMALSSRQPTRA
ncbi:MAG: hypothetical protein ACI835_004851 [Planctomycetota bacterium]|jgi:hypothetical protein